MELTGGLHLTYCTNIHPAERWGEVLDNLARHTVPLKARLCPHAPFGVGLRLSDQASRELLEGENLPAFQAFLASHGLYVFTLNGFPFGAFHGERVKAGVFAPDWRDPRRADYTLRLADILQALLPSGMDGGISTVPLSFRAWLQAGAGDWDAMAVRLADVALSLSRREAASGRWLHVDLEPEPGGALETTSHVVRFFQEHLLRAGAAHLAASAGLSKEAASQVLLRHVQVCYDACHQAVVYERPTEALARLAESGIRVGKLQVSTALKIAMPAAREGREALLRRLAPFAEGTYLHQVMARREDDLIYYEDLAEAMADAFDPAVQEWRVHYHVPIFADRFGGLTSTQPELAETLAVLRQSGFTRHAEIETYTWDVLPERPLSLLDALAREYGWVRSVWGAPRTATAGREAR